MSDYDSLTNSTVTGVTFLGASLPILPHLDCEPHDETLEILQCALDILSDERRWIKSSYSREVLVEVPGVPGAHMEEEGQFCLMGALEYCSRVDSISNIGLNNKKRDARIKARDFLLEILERGTGYGTVEGFNDADHTTHADVVELIKDAIAFAKKELAAPTESKTKGSADGETYG